MTFIRPHSHLSPLFLFSARSTYMPACICSLLARLCDQGLETCGMLQGIKKRKVSRLSSRKKSGTVKLIRDVEVRRGGSVAEKDLWQYAKSQSHKVELVLLSFQDWGCHSFAGTPDGSGCDNQNSTTLVTCKPYNLYCDIYFFKKERSKDLEISAVDVS